MTDEALRAEQVQRERSQRDEALGRRYRSAERGDLGPVVKRWVAATVLPTAARVREFAQCYLRGETVEAGAILGSTVFGLSPEISGSKSLEPILKWCLKGNSKGRADKGTTYCEDLVLAVVGTAMMRCSVAGAPVAFTPCLMACGSAARETSMGQFITSVQGSKAMERVRKGKDRTWKQTKQMDAVAALLGGQVRAALAGVTSPSPEERAVRTGHRETVEVLTQKGEARQIELRVPEEGDWELLEVARKVKGEGDPHKSTWASFAMIVLAAAQAEAGVFELVGIPQPGKKPAHGIGLSKEASGAILKDLDKWLHMGFVQAPMLTCPENGDYLTVKHREVAGARGPKGIRTNARDSAAWGAASEVLAGTAWRVGEDALPEIRGGCLEASARRAEPEDARRELVLGAYSRLVGRDFYLPIYMDFRGRVYPRPTVVTTQGSDLQKGLLTFPSDGTDADALDEDAWDSLILHCSNLYKTGGLDKAPLDARWDWWYSIADRSAEEIVQEADKPVQLWQALTLTRKGEPNRVPCQIDGTCNGLQHLTALFRDDTSAPWVNLTAASQEVPPNDLYGRVAEAVGLRLGVLDEPWARRVAATVKVDRKLCKKPVMVLPYGGTRGTIEEAALEAVLDQSPSAEVHGRAVCPWRECLRPDSMGGWVRDEAAVLANYLAFRERDLSVHPLLRLDAQRLGGLIWQAIVEILPRPIEAMKAFRGIAKSVGSRSLEWSTGFATSAGGPLWIVQAKALSSTSRLHLKGLHLPDSIRGLAMRTGRDEIDKASHAGSIVANAIHSQDADHLARTMARFSARNGGRASFGAVHDAYYTRATLMPGLGRDCREAFFDKYGVEGNHPLEQPVRLRSLDGALEEYPSWYALADAAKVSFPDMGTWDPREVLESCWFFS